MQTDQKTVFVGLSGGVDSSVAALRLQKEDYNVVGVFIKVWQPDWLECNWEQERLDAMRVAAHLDIPFLTCDAETAYKQGVADYFISEYQAGRTPNPDVLCNQKVKFGAFLDFAREHGADLIATGHYVRKGKVKTKNKKVEYQLLRGVDANKDQSYFLYTLSQEQLAQSLFPVGNSPKDQIRKEAEAAGIPVATKKDSQGVCFLGHIDIPEFLAHYTDLIPGEVCNESGAVVGTHQGALVYTVGQRHGFTIDVQTADSERYYVVRKDMVGNRLIVATKKPRMETSDTMQVADMHWISGTPSLENKILVQIRYRQEAFLASVNQEGEATHLTPVASTDAYALGQSCVLYSYEKPEICLGGGIITA